MTAGARCQSWRLTSAACGQEHCYPGTREHRLCWRACRDRLPSSLPEQIRCDACWDALIDNNQIGMLIVALTTEPFDSVPSDVIERLLNSPSEQVVDIVFSALEATT